MNEKVIAFSSKTKESSNLFQVYSIHALCTIIWLITKYIFLLFRMRFCNCKLAILEYDIYPYSKLFLFGLFLISNHKDWNRLKYLDCLDYICRTFIMNSDFNICKFLLYGSLPNGFHSKYFYILSIWVFHYIASSANFGMYFLNPMKLVHIEYS